MSTQQPDTEPEEVEGLGQGEDAAWRDYPIDTLLIRNETRTIHDVLRRIEKGSFVMDPDFQRDFIWPEDKQSKLIESVLMRIPLPVFYFAEDHQGRMVVVDGLQRLSTFQRFVNNELRLRFPKRSDREELDEKRFQDLSPKFQNRIEDCNLVLYLIDAKVPEQARLDIFERVNGGVPLTRQQMRNCLYMGEATRFLKTEANSPLFLKATGKSLQTEKMRDREFVNRFCAFQLLPLEEYRSDMDDFLANALKRMNDLDPPDLQRLSAEFRTGLSNNFKVFREHAFRRSAAGDRRSLLNASLWDVMTTGLSRYPEPLVEARTDALREAFYALMKEEKKDEEKDEEKDRNFVWSITYGPNDLTRVRYRFKATKAMFEEVLGAHPA